MKHHLKAKTREEPDHVILHVGTNDMNSDREPELLSKSTVDSTFKSSAIDVRISNIIVCSYKYKEEGIQVNSHLKCLWKSHNLNKSKLHLKKGEGNLWVILLMQYPLLFNEV